MAHNKPFVFIARELFCEQDGLLSNLMKPYGRCIEMTQYDFEKGNWAPYLMRALYLPAPQDRGISFDGHQVISDILENIYNGIFKH